MNSIVQNLVTKMKSKQLSEWDFDQLEEFAYAIGYMYTYIDPTKDKQEKETLTMLYSKIAEWVNSNFKRGYSINPAHLRNIDKHRNE